MRLIDADNVNWGRCPVSGYAMKEWLAEQPTIDAVPVVRCKDCKKMQKDEIFGGMWCNRMTGTYRVKEDDFCSYGEKRCDDAV